MFLVGLGLWRMLSGNLIGGMWMILIGFFLQNAARMSYQQILVRKALEGEPVRRFMEKNPVTVSPSSSVEQLVEDYVYQTHHKMYPVVEFGRLVGCVSVKQIKEVPREQRGIRTVAELAAACSEENTIHPDTDAVDALSRMSRTAASRLMVVQDGRLVGIIALKDLMKFLSVKMELEE
jgi:predicted transcriptional regulator